MSPRLSVITDVVERLARINPMGETELMPSGDPIRFPAYHVFDPGHRTDQSEPGATRYALDLNIEGYVERDGGLDAYTALHTLYEDAVAALLDGEPLGGVAETVDEGDLSITVAVLSERRRLAFALTINITFPATRANPAQHA